ncbi:MAG: radical SAM protein [Myxococcales bacterium]
MRPALLCTVPPFATNTPPTGPAALLGYLAAHGCDDFGFADLQLALPGMPLSYSLVGAFGESFVRDIPDSAAGAAPSAHGARGALARARSGRRVRRVLSRALDPPGAVARGARHAGARSRELGGDAAGRVVGLTTWSSNYLTSLLAAAHLKRARRETFVVAGGPQVTESHASAELALRSGLVDVVVVGEGEATLLEVYRAFREKRSARGIPGTAWLEDDGRTVSRLPRPLLKMAELGPPAFEKTFVPAYRRRGLRILSHALSRGCVGECAFCSEWSFWERFRPALAERAVEQVEVLVRHHGAQHLQMTDSLLNGHWGRLNDFAEGLLRRGLDVSWSGFLRADMDLPTARLLARSGFKGAFVGVESLADGTLAQMNKGLSAQKSAAALEALLQAGIEVQVGVIPGFPGDSREGLMGTVKKLLELQGRFPGLVTLNVEPFVVSPGQPIYGELEKRGLKATGWDEATLEIAPELRDVAERVLCQVEGANQGIDRLGQLRTLTSVAVNAPVSTGGAVVGASGPISFKPLGAGVSLLAVDEAARAKYLLVTDAERAAVEGELANARARGETWTREEIHRVEAHHVPPAAEPEWALGFAPEPGPDAKWLLSPLVVARTLGDTLWLLDAVGLGFVRLSAALVPVVERLRSPATRAELAAAAPHGARAALDDALEGLREGGMLANA